MKRQEIRDSKRVIREATSREATPLQIERARTAALALLEHSMAMRHDRLALRRLTQAIALGASLASNHWAYCTQAASRLDEGALDKLLHSLQRLAQS